ncbi:MAG: hypothetical protein JO275_04655 [Verrucomicrobia bacterium]|nr:hypothetical protein [Verrucomicrobiota bacterium]
MQLELLLRDTRKSLLAERKGKGDYRRLARAGYRLEGTAFCKGFNGFHMNTSVGCGV